MNNKDEKPERQVHLTKPQDIRRFLSKIVNQVINNKIDVNKANCAGQICNVLLRAMEKTVLEKRIEELEKLVERLLSEGDHGIGKTN